MCVREREKASRALEREEGENGFERDREFGEVHHIPCSLFDVHYPPSIEVVMST